MSLMSNLFRPALHHPLGRLAPWRTLSRILRWQIASRLRPGVHDRKWIEGAHLLVERGMTGATGNLYFGLHECADMGFMMHLLRPGDLLVDVGANIGSYTILAAKIAGANVIAVEPHPQTADRLEANVIRNGIQTQVAIRRAALSDAEGIGALTSGRDTMNQLVAIGKDTVAVELTTLDAVVGNREPTALKIDVEGHEPAVFAGAHATIMKPSLVAIAIETIDEGILSQMADSGFVERFYDPFTRMLTTARGNIESSNRLFIRDVAAVAARLSSARQFDVAGFML